MRKQPQRSWLAKGTCYISRISLAFHCGWEQSWYIGFGIRHVLVQMLALPPACHMTVSSEAVLSSEKIKGGNSYSQSAFLRTQCQAQPWSGWLVFWHQSDPRRCQGPWCWAKGDRQESSIYAREDHASVSVFSPVEVLSGDANKSL